VYIGRPLVLLLYSRNSCFQGILKLVKIYSKVIGIEESNVAFWIYIDVWMVVLVYKKQEDASSGAKYIVVSEFK